MTDYKYKELKSIAKANGLPSVMVKKEELIKILSDRNLLPENDDKILEDKPQEIKSKEIETKKIENSDKDDFTEIPKDLAYLGLSPIKRLTPKDVDISYLTSYKAKLCIPRHIEEKVIREGYRIFFPLEKEATINYKTRGCEFILDDNGNSIKIDAQMPNGNGETIYHVAMKQKLELWEQEKKLFAERQKTLETGIKKGGVLTHKKNKLEVEEIENTTYLKHTTELKDIDMSTGKIL